MPVSCSSFHYDNMSFWPVSFFFLHEDLLVFLAGHFCLWWFCVCFILFSFIFISWRLITLQYCSGFCHTLTWISHGFTCIPLPDPPSCLPCQPIPLGLPSAPALSTCLMHPTWAGDLFHPWYYTCFNALLSEHPTLTISHRVQKSVLYICVSFSVLHIGLSLPSFFKFHICVSILYGSLSFWLTSLCIIGSSFIHPIRPDSNEFFFFKNSFAGFSILELWVLFFA